MAIGIESSRNEQTLEVCVFYSIRTASVTPIYKPFSIQHSWIELRQMKSRRLKMLVINAGSENFLQDALLLYL